MSIARQPLLKYIEKLRSFDGLKNKLLPQKDLSSVAVNGSGSYIPPICRLTLTYDPPRIGAGGDSKGMVDYLQQSLPQFAASRPYAEFAVVNQRGPPTLIATYNNGSQRQFNCQRLSAAKVDKAVKALCDSVGASHAARKFPKPVLKGSGSARDHVLPAWDPFHTKQIFRP
eukprot:jgi/Hompol1/1343/HPOL_005570-RA